MKHGMHTLPRANPSLFIAWVLWQAASDRFFSMYQYGRASCTVADDPSHEVLHHHVLLTLRADAVREFLGRAPVHRKVQRNLKSGLLSASTHNEMTPSEGTYSVEV